MTAPDDAADAIGEIRRLFGPSAGDHAVRLGGLTNRVFRTEADGRPVVLRLPGAGTGAYIDRVAEAEMARLAAQAGVSPAVLHADPATGVMVTDFVGGCATMSAAAFRADPGSVGRAALVLRKLHRSGVEFPARFDLFPMIDGYLKVLAGSDVALPAGYHDVVAEAGAVRRALDASHVQPVACHCDPLCENFLDDGLRMWLVDWEYSGMNDPMWDLGDLSVEGGFTTTQDLALLDAYFEGAVPPSSHARMIMHKAMCDLVWTLWGLIQLAGNNPADDFRAYADNRFDRCKALMATAEFDRSRRLLAAG
jgi:thiamine kinase-like enzyme